jgi:hypothetical protein
MIFSSQMVNRRETSREDMLSAIAGLASIVGFHVRDILTGAIANSFEEAPRLN